VPGQGKQVGVVLNALVGAAIPVIVRHGETVARVSLSDLALVKVNAGAGEATPALSFHIHREGNRSVYGDLIARFTPKGGEAVEVGRATGVAVYVPNGLRKVVLPLQTPWPAGNAVGAYSVVFRERPEAGGKTLAEATL